MSSSELAITVRGLSKAYTIRHNQPKYTTLADALIDRIKHPIRNSTKEIFWALKEVGFDIFKGEIVGIIGRNGSGKSTLLKILSRITRPTHGEINLYGRVGSLLEVGTGFHQELSGRENIFLSGTILGMKKCEIKQQFDAIVDFAGVEQFLDTPVKRYSSGMYVRLAFAVAAHLNPEILLVDEVLAVGDAEFQQKCLGKMDDVAKGGRTVLFVSHNVSAIERLCGRCIVLNRGTVKFVGPTKEAVQAHSSEVRETSGRLNTVGRSTLSNKVQVVDAWLEQNGEQTGQLEQTRNLELVVVVCVKEQTNFVVELILRQQDGIPVAFSSSGLVQRLQIAGQPNEQYTVRCQLPDHILARGEYSIDIMLSVIYAGQLDRIKSAIGFSVDSAYVGEQGWNFSQRYDFGYLYWDVKYIVARTVENSR